MQHAYPQTSQNVQVFRKRVVPNLPKSICNIAQRKEEQGAETC